MPGRTVSQHGQTTFALPNLQGRSPIHAGQGPGFDNHPLGQAGGAETVSLSLQQVPAHNHQLNASAAAASAAIPTGNVLAKKARFGKDVFAAAANSVPMAPAALTPAGGSQPHTNMQPYLTLNFVIALAGIFPSRN